MRSSPNIQEGRGALEKQLHLDAPDDEINYCYNKDYRVSIRSLQQAGRNHKRFSTHAAYVQRATDKDGYTEWLWSGKEERAPTYEVLCCLACVYRIDCLPGCAFSL
jgi:hypothetical protein